jgi:hypothetical protein
MLSYELSSSEKFSEYEEMLRGTNLLGYGLILYPLLIAHSDDFGNFSASPWDIKMQIIPSFDVDKEQIDNILKLLEKTNLVEIYNIEEKPFLHITNFKKYQSIRHPKARFPKKPESGNVNQNQTFGSFGQNGQVGQSPAVLGKSGSFGQVGQSPAVLGKSGKFDKNAHEKSRVEESRVEESRVEMSRVEMSRDEMSREEESDHATQNVNKMLTENLLSGKPTKFSVPVALKTSPSPEQQQAAELEQKLVSLGLTKRQAIVLMSDYNHDEIRQQLEWLPLRNPKSPPAYLINSVREAWEDPDIKQLRREADYCARDNPGCCGGQEQACQYCKITEEARIAANRAKLKLISTQGVKRMEDAA